MSLQFVHGFLSCTNEQVHCENTFLILCLTYCKHINEKSALMLYPFTKYLSKVIMNEVM